MGEANGFGAGLAVANRGVARMPGALAEDRAELNDATLKRQSVTRLATPATDAPVPNPLAPPMPHIDDAHRITGLYRNQSAPTPIRGSFAPYAQRPPRELHRDF
jgi:hypothetical protein